MMISKRLAAVAALLRSGDKTADIGTDHALLPVYLIENTISPAVIASDISEGPAAVARNTVKEAGLEPYITVRVGNGLETIQPDEVGNIVIAGMGGETIAEILDATPWVRDAKYRLVLQPMTHAEAVHVWLDQNGFTILEEHLLNDAGRDYVLLSAEYTATPPHNDAFLHWRGAFSSPEGRPYWRKTAVHLHKRADGCLERGDEPQAALFRRLAQQLEEI